MSRCRSNYSAAAWAKANQPATLYEASSYEQQGLLVIDGTMDAWQSISANNAYDHLRYFSYLAIRTKNGSHRHVVADAFLHTEMYFKDDCGNANVRWIFWPHKDLFQLLAWGTENGEKRNRTSALRKLHKPLISLNFRWPSENEVEEHLDNFKA